MRDGLNPRRLTMVMWDNAYLLRHIPGGLFENFDKVLDETIERGYNTLRLDPMPQWIDLSKSETVLEWPEPQTPYMVWNWNTAVKGPVGTWLVEFMEKVLKPVFQFRPDRIYRQGVQRRDEGLATGIPGITVYRLDSRRCAMAGRRIIIASLSLKTGKMSDGIGD